MAVLECMRRGAAHAQMKRDTWHRVTSACRMAQAVNQSHLPCLRLVLSFVAGIRDDLELALTFTADPTCTDSMPAMRSTANHVESIIQVCRPGGFLQW